MENPYLRLTDQFNRGRLRAILASGQAVVLYRLAIMSKDGDWILREDAEAIEHVLGTLGTHGARYRFGAPLASIWPGLAKRLVDLGLEEAHEIMVSRAEEVLPFRP